MSARQLQDLLSSVVKLPVAANASAAAVSAVSANPGSAAAVAAAAVVVSARSPGFGCSDRRCHLRLPKISSQSLRSLVLCLGASIYDVRTEGGRGLAQKKM